ncbi:MAG: hypothetical protein HFF09_00385 [Oscillospiraceae bacterium]|nr:hypothetical protein [Oscillospiraceae bacterium]
MKAFNPLTDLPMGLGATLTHNHRALDYLTSLAPDEQRQVIDSAQNLHSPAEMRAYMQLLMSGIPRAF